MPATADRPAVRRGDLWRFASHDHLRATRFEETRRVVEVSAERIVCAVESTDPLFAGGRFEYTREWNLLSRPALGAAGAVPEDVGRWIWTPQYPQLRFPLAAGKRWRGTATVANPATDTRNVHRYRAGVLAARSLEVPAGRFCVLPVRFESDVASDDGQSKLAWRNVELLHYAPNANHFIRYEQHVAGPGGKPARDVLLELLAYEPAR